VIVNKFSLLIVISIKELFDMAHMHCNINIMLREMG